jgi:hypothetical protein
MENLQRFQMEKPEGRRRSSNHSTPLHSLADAAATRPATIRFAPDDSVRQNTAHVESYTGF